MAFVRVALILFFIVDSAWAGEPGAPPPHPEPTSGCTDVTREFSPDALSRALLSYASQLSVISRQPEWNARELAQILELAHAELGNTLPVLRAKLEEIKGGTSVMSYADGTLVHNLRNQIVPAANNLNVLLAILPKDGTFRPTREQQAYMEKLVRALGLLHAMTAKQPGQIVKAPFPIHEITPALQDMLQGIFPKPFVTDVTAATPVYGQTMNGDQSEIIAALGNILSNINAHAFPAGGGHELRVEIDVSRADMTVTPEPPGTYRPDPIKHSGPYQRFTIRDYGKGMSHDQMVGAWTRGESTGGTGRGLAHVREIVRAHGGFIEVVSAEGKGTEVRIYLPFEPETEEPKPLPITAEAKASQPADVVVIDDNTDDGNMIKLRLRHEKRTTAVAPDDAAGLAAIVPGKRQVILLDIRMPWRKEPAWKVLQAIKERNPNAKVIIYSVLAKSDLPKEERGHYDAADGWIEKGSPTSIDEINKALGGP